MGRAAGAPYWRSGGHQIKPRFGLLQYVLHPASHPGAGAAVLWVTELGANAEDPRFARALACGEGRGVESVTRRLDGVGAGRNQSKPATSYPRPGNTLHPSYRPIPKNATISSTLFSGQ
jgi:hypothetical protein